MSAIADSSDGPNPIIKAYFALYPGFDTLDFTGPLEVFSWAQHNIRDASTKAFKCQFVAASEHTVSAQGASFRAHMDYGDAHADLEECDVLIVPGGAVTKAIDPILAAAKDLPTTNATATAEEVRDGSAPDEYKEIDEDEEGEDPNLAKLPEPLKLVKRFAALQKSDPGKERTLIAIGTGSLLLAQLGLLQGLGATTHPDYYTKLEITCQEAARRGDYEQSDVMEERYVVNNARFALGEGNEENPWILRKRPDGRTKSIARKGSNAWKEGNRRRESIARRATLRLGGLRVITSGGTAAGLDVALYLVAAMVSHESAEEVARLLQYKWEKGVTVDGIDV